MFRSLRSITVSANVMAPANPQHAQVAGDDDLDDIVVSASRIVQKRYETGQSIIVVEKDELDRRQTQILCDGLRASWSISDNLKIYGRVENLFDEAYQTAFNHYVPGRAGYAGGRLKM